MTKHNQQALVYWSKYLLSKTIFNLFLNTLRLTDCFNELASEFHNFGPV